MISQKIFYNTSPESRGTDIRPLLICPRHRHIFHPDVQTPTQDTAPGFFLSLPHLSHKRSSSPDPPPSFSADPRRDGARYGSSSPELYLPEPDFHQYSSSYQPPSVFSRTLPNPNQPSSQHHSNTTSSWYMNEGMDRGYWNSGHRGGGGGGGGGGYHSSSHTLPPPSGPKNLPPPGKNQMDESIDLQDMLKIWDESKKNPFGTGTLV